MTAPLHLFEAVGIELEYMIVDRETLNVLPIADRVLAKVAGSEQAEVDMGGLAWSNELALHVVEIKTNGPAAQLVPLTAAFQSDVGRINDLLAPWQGQLMPTGMHPWMDPHTEFKIWPHEYGPVYHAFDRIFDCSGHGWANLQSAHINLPFAGDEEFARLHAAIRLILPIIPALAASSPVVDGALSGVLDTRLDVYRANARRLPSVTGRVVPEAVDSAQDYQRVILEPIYADLAPLDPEGILRYEWVNARGAIARFDRGAIEIRVIDVQECPQADLAVASAVIGVVTAWVTERLADHNTQRRFELQPLVDLLTATVKDADEAVVSDPGYLDLCGVPPRTSCSARELWAHLIEATTPEPAWDHALGTILTRGCLARRITHALGPRPGRGQIADVYRDLGQCLARGVLFGTDH